jgi:hypothetical protein
MTQPEQEFEAPLVAQSAAEREQLVEQSYDVAFGSAPADAASGYLGEDLVNASNHLREQNAAQEAGGTEEHGLLDGLSDFAHTAAGTAADTAHGLVEGAENMASSAWESVQHAAGDAEQYLDEHRQDLIDETQHGIADM